MHVILKKKREKNTVESYAASVSQVGNVRCTATSGPDVGIMLIIFLKGTGRLDRSLASTVLCILMTHPAGDMHINNLMR
jgi:hypothetical protein